MSTKGKENNSTIKALWQSIKKTAQHFNALTAPKPEDSFFRKVLKLGGRVLGIIATIALSPLVILALILAFIAAL